jgi:hypothetical protein
MNNLVQYKLQVSAWRWMIEKRLIGIAAEPSCQKSFSNIEYKIDEICLTERLFAAVIRYVHPKISSKSTSFNFFPKFCALWWIFSDHRPIYNLYEFRPRIPCYVPYAIKPQVNLSIFVFKWRQKRFGEKPFWWFLDWISMGNYSL